MKVLSILLFAVSFVLFFNFLEVRALDISFDAYDQLTLSRSFNSDTLKYWTIQEEVYPNGNKNRFLHVRTKMNDSTLLLSDSDKNFSAFSFSIRFRFNVLKLGKNKSWLGFIFNYISSESYSLVRFDIDGIDSQQRKYTVKLIDVQNGKVMQIAMIDKKFHNEYWNFLQIGYASDGSMMIKLNWLVYLEVSQQYSLDSRVGDIGLRVGDEVSVDFDNFIFVPQGI